MYVMFIFRRNWMKFFVLGKVIVYGHDLRSHCALAALIEYGIPRELLVFVNPISRTFDVENLISYDNLIYDDPDIEIAIVRILQKEGITLYQVSTLTSLNTEVE